MKEDFLATLGISENDEDRWIQDHGDCYLGTGSAYANENRGNYDWKIVEMKE